MKRERFYVSKYCQVLTNEKRTIVCHTGNGLVLKMPTYCWEIISKFIESYSIEEICDAASDEEDKKYLKSIFESLINRGMLVREEEKQVKCVDIIITNRCNLKCIHCCAAAEDMHTDDKLSTEEIFQIIDKVVKLNPCSVVITGGEPMLRKDFFKISWYLKEKYSGKIGLMTNGTFISESNVAELVKIYDTFDISIDGYDEESCSKIRGKGVFSKVLKAVDMLKKQGVDSKKIALSMVVTSYTEGKEELFLDLNKKLGTGVVIRDFSPIGRGAENKGVLEVRAKKRQTANNDGIEIFDAMKKNSKKKGEIPRCQNCLAGVGKIAINHEGNMYPCSLLEKDKYCMGNIQQVEDFEKYYATKAYEKSQGYKNLKTVLPKYREKCKDCNVRTFCVYCLADFEMHIDSEMFDEVCRMKKAELQYIWEE